MGTQNKIQIYIYIGACAPMVGPYGEEPSPIGTAHPPLQAHLCIINGSPIG